MTIEVAPAPDYPPGDYAIVELFGHTTLVGRVAEVERFGTKMLAIEPLFKGAFLGVVFHGGASIYRLTPCSAAVAFARSPTEGYEIPPTIRATIEPALLEAPRRSFAETEAREEAIDGDALEGGDGGFGE